MKIVINDCYGGFGLSKIALESYANRKGIKLGDWHQTWGFFDGLVCREIERNDNDLIDIVESLGDLANGSYSKLKIVEVPDDVEWHIAEYDGMEHIAENHRIWS